MGKTKKGVKLNQSIKDLENLNIVLDFYEVFELQHNGVVEFQFDYQGGSYLHHEGVLHILKAPKGYTAKKMSKNEGLLELPDFDVILNHTRSKILILLAMLRDMLKIESMKEKVETISMRGLARLLRKDVATTDEHLSDLEQMGFLDIVRNKGRGGSVIKLKNGITIVPKSFMLEIRLENWDIWKGYMENSVKISENYEGEVYMGVAEKWEEELDKEEDMKKTHVEWYKDWETLRQNVVMKKGKDLFSQDVKKLRALPEAITIGTRWRNFFKKKEK